MKTKEILISFRCTKNIENLMQIMADQTHSSRSEIVRWSIMKGAITLANSANKGEQKKIKKAIDALRQNDI